MITSGTNACFIAQSFAVSDTSQSNTERTGFGEFSVT